MRVDSVNFTGQKMGAVKLAKSICKTKMLPENITRSAANNILKKGEIKLLGSALGGLTVGMGSGTALMANFVNSSSSLSMLGFGVMLASLITFMALNIKRDRVEDAYNILNGEDIYNKILENADQWYKDKVNNIKSRKLR